MTTWTPVASSFQSSLPVEVEAGGADRTTRPRRHWFMEPGV